MQSTWDLFTEKVWESQKCKTELGIEKNTFIKSQDMQEVTSGTIDQMPLNNGYSISYTEALINSSFKDGLLISEWESGLELHGSHSLSTLSDLALDKENMITTLMITSTSQIEYSNA